MVENMLNLGCGRRYHPDWINGDLVPVDPGIQEINILGKLPFPHESMDVVYHSHVLEHLEEKDGHYFLGECHRILKPGGIIRVVVPDLEGIVNFYLTTIRELEKNPDLTMTMVKHRWAIIELFDQITRESSGGKVYQFLEETGEEGRQIILDRWGREAEGILEVCVEGNGTPVQPTDINTFRKWIKRIFPSKLHEMMDVLRTNRFRKSGEIHRTMYDFWSLRSILSNSGFSKISRRDAFSSEISKWHLFYLDYDQRKQVYKPDSLYLEAYKE